MGWTPPHLDGIDVPDWKCHPPVNREKESVMKLIRVGVDLAKNGFQVHGHSTAMPLAKWETPSQRRTARMLRSTERKPRPHEREHAGTRWLDGRAIMQALTGE